MNNKAFTIIELLVVITVISILAAIIFPVFSEAREKARETQCLSNIKQIGTAFMMYMDDYEGCYPAAPIADNLIHKFEGEFYCGHTVPLTAADVPRAQFGSYRAQLASYVKADKLFFCPSDRRNIAKDYAWEVKKRFTSYHYRYFIGARSVVSEHKETWTENMLSEPSRTFIFHEYLPFHKGYKMMGSTSSKDDPWEWTDKSRFNMLFGDGHAKSYATAESIPWNGETGTYDYHWPKHNDGAGTWGISSRLWDID